MRFLPKRVEFGKYGDLYELSKNLCSSRMKRITFELNDELHKKLKLLCYTESLSIGHILRQCVSDFCDKHDAHLIELIDKRSK
ncbi:plasmid partition protein ParG [Synechococcus sp. MVIR-18-1]|uniref:plasmid partition protein ParG n=1 Tax=Synechococcus sp. MVIR-18-1 TaxID=1386941 RepID=UPI001645AAF4|nr:plasmid partition protein ParG [Synechococcus sp. MVIR-18-1]